MALCTEKRGFAIIWIRRCFGGKNMFACIPQLINC